MATCWIVTYDIPYESTSVISVHTSEYGARKFAARWVGEQHKDNLEFFYMLRQHNPDFKYRTDSWKIVNADQWTDGNDYLYVEEMELSE